MIRLPKPSAPEKVLNLLLRLPGLRVVRLLLQLFQRPPVIFRRLQNPTLKDEVKRVGREPIRKLTPGDRLIKPLTTTASYGLPVDHFVYGAAAALRFDCPDDPQSVELLQKIAAVGADKALTEYSGLQPDDPLHGRILEVYRALASGDLTKH